MEFSERALFDNTDSAGLTSVDRQASMARYQVLLTKKLRDLFPEDDVSVCQGIFDLSITHISTAVEMWVIDRILNRTAYS